MTYESQILVSLLSSAIHNQKPIIAVQNLIDWNTIYEEAQAHQIHSLLYPILPGLETQIRPNQDLLLMWHKASIAVLSEQIHHIERMKDILTLFHLEGIQVILLKGLVLRDYYPNPDLRTMGDADLLVNLPDINRIRTILLNLGYVEAEATLKHYGFYHNHYPAIEIHWMLSNMEEHKHSSPITEQMRGHAISYDFYGIPVMTLSPEDQFLHQIHHLANHFKTTGFGLRQLCDLTLYCKHMHNILNWSYIDDQLLQYGLKHFSEVILCLCSRLLGLNNPFQLGSDEDLSYLDLFIDDMIEAGVYGKRTPERNACFSFTKYIDTSSTIRFRNLRYVLRLLFPTAKYLNSGYSYAKRHRLLLPLAWFHRIINNVTRKDLLKYSKEISSISKERAKLLRWLRLP